MFDFNPIQMGPDFTSFHISEIEIEVRDMINELRAGFMYHSIPVDRINLELKYRGLDYNLLPQSCKDMIDKLDVY